MFYSIPLLVRRDAKFFVVWKISTASAHGKIAAAKLNKSDILSQHVVDLCKSIVDMVPKRAGDRGVPLREAAQKFSLYVIAQLLFGTTVVYEKQVDYLQTDAEMLLEAIKRDYFNFKACPIEQPAKIKRRTMTKQKYFDDADDLEVNRGVIMSVDDLILDDIPAANFQSFTLQEQNPFVWSHSSLFPESDDLVPLKSTDIDDFDAQWGVRDANTLNTFVDEFGSNQDRSLVRNIDTFQPERTMLPEANDQLEKMDVQLPDDLLVQETLQQEDAEKHQHTERSTSSRIERIRASTNSRPFTPVANVEAIALDSMRDENANLEPPTVGKKRRFDADDELELDSQIKDAPTSAKRKRRRGVAQIPEEPINEMRFLRDNYASLVHAPDDLRVKFSRHAFDAQNVFDPSPYFIRDKRFPEILRDLYQTHEYDSEKGFIVSDEESERMATPPRGRVQEWLDLDFDNMHFGKAFFRESPTSPTIYQPPVHEERNETDPLIPLHDTGLEHLIHIPIEEQLILPNETENFEMPRRVFRGDRSSFSTLDQRGAFTTLDEVNGSLRNAFNLETENDELLEAYSRSGPLDTGFERAAENIMKSANLDWTTFQNVVEPSKSSKRFAARSFYTLLDLLKNSKIEVSQEMPYGPIRFRLSSVESDEKTIGAETSEELTI